MVRRWMVHARSETGIVDRQEVMAALMDAEAVQWRCGGVLTTMHHRQPTEVPGEMVTVAVIFEWKDRTDARAQPESATLPEAAPEPPAAPEPAVAPAPAVAPQAAVAAPALAVGHEPDGLDLSTLEEEDLSSVSEAMR